jgi:hypothetical protein
VDNIVRALGVFFQVQLSENSIVNKLNEIVGLQRKKKIGQEKIMGLFFELDSYLK